MSRMISEEQRRLLWMMAQQSREDSIAAELNFSRDKRVGTVDVPGTRYVPVDWSSDTYEVIDDE